MVPGHQTLADAIILLRRSEDDHSAHAATKAISTTPTASPLRYDSSDDEGFTSDDDSDNEGGSTPTHPSWAATTTYANGTVAALKHEEHWQHPLANKALPREAIIAMIALGIFIIMLIVSTWFWKKRKKRVNAEKERQFKGFQMAAPKTGGYGFAGGAHYNVDHPLQPVHPAGQGPWQRIPPAYDEHDDYGEKGWMGKVRQSVRQSVGNLSHLGHRPKEYYGEDYEREREEIPRVHFATVHNVAECARRV